MPARPARGAFRNAGQAVLGLPSPSPSCPIMSAQPVEVSLRDVLSEIADAIPSEVHPNIIIIGSLAAGYGLFRRDEVSMVRTKDVDCVLSPHVVAVEKGRAVAERLLRANWKPKGAVEFGRPGTSETPENQLPAVRLYPPRS